MEKKTLGMSNNVFYGLCWLLMVVPTVEWIAVVLAIIALVKGGNELEEKRDLVALIVAFVVKCMFCWLFFPYFYVLGAAIVVCIARFQGKTNYIPGVYHIAKLFVK